MCQCRSKRILPICRTMRRSGNIAAPWMWSLSRYPLRLAITRNRNRSEAAPIRIDETGGCVASRWLQKAGNTHEHFHVELSKWRLALQAGAVEVSMMELGRILRALRESREILELVLRSFSWHHLTQGTGGDPAKPSAGRP